MQGAGRLYPTLATSNGMCAKLNLGEGSFYGLGQFLESLGIQHSQKDVVKAWGGAGASRSAPHIRHTVELLSVLSMYQEIHFPLEFFQFLFFWGFLNFFLTQKCFIFI